MKGGMDDVVDSTCFTTAAVEEDKGVAIQRRQELEIGSPEKEQTEGDEAPNG